MPDFGCVLVDCCIVDSVDCTAGWDAAAQYRMALAQDTGQGMDSTIVPTGTGSMTEVEVQDDCSPVHSLRAQATHILDSKIAVVAEGSQAATTMGMVAGLAPRPFSQREA